MRNSCIFPEGAIVCWKNWNCVYWGKMAYWQNGNLALKNASFFERSSVFFKFSFNLIKFQFLYEKKFSFTLKKKSVSKKCNFVLKEFHFVLKKKYISPLKKWSLHRKALLITRTCTTFVAPVIFVHVEIRTECHKLYFRPHVLKICFSLR